MRRLTPRRWRILFFLALESYSRVDDMALVVGVSRVTAHRDLAWLHNAGLVTRWHEREDKKPTGGGKTSAIEASRCSSLGWRRSAVRCRCIWVDVARVPRTICSFCR